MSPILYRNHLQFPIIPKEMFMVCPMSVKSSSGVLHLIPFFFHFQGVQGALSRYVCLPKQRMGWERLGGWRGPESSGFCALLRSKSVPRLEPETIPMELKTRCRIPGMREMLRKFQGRLHLSMGIVVPGTWLSLHQ